ncbi:MAG: LuxR C-terminal-related transcriptional regulator [Dehalococcoidia bacterium]
MWQNLPLRIDAFIGRAVELEEIKRRLASHRGLTITGPAGVGKTRLATEAAVQLSEEFRHEVHFVDVSPLVEQAEIVQAVATALGYSIQGSDSISSIADQLGDAPALLVLDNCDYAASACASLLEDLLARCPNLAILATSQSILGVPGEQILQVRPLAIPNDLECRKMDRSELLKFDGLRLFEERARVGADWFQIVPENAIVIAELCRRLDGMPLALELAAARVRSMSIAQIVERLDIRFRLLRSVGRSGVTRHRSLRSAIDWSYALLLDDERILFQRLSVFGGGWTLDAAESVCAGEDLDPVGVFDVMSRLVDRSLVNFQPGEFPRYSMLSSLRQYGQEKLITAGESEAIERRFLSWFVGMAEQSRMRLRSSESVETRARLRAEAINFRAAVELAKKTGDHDSMLRIVSALGRFWYSRISAPEVKRWAAECISAAKGLQNPLVVDVMADSALWQLRTGDDQRARELLTEALRLARELGEDRHLAGALWTYGVFCGDTGQPEESRKALVEVLQLARRSENDPEMQWFQIVTLNALGYIESNANESFVLPEQYWTEAVQAAERFEMPWVGWEALGNLGEAARSRKDYVTARAHFERSNAIAFGLGNSTGGGIGLVNLAYVMLATGQWREAASQLQAFFDNDAELGIAPALTEREPREGWKRSRVAWTALGALAGALHHAGRPSEAARMLGAGQIRQNPQSAADLEDQATTRDALLRILGDEEFQREYAAGQRLGAREALDLAGRLLAEVCATENSVPVDTPATVASLSAREREVLGLVALGMSNRQIADALVLSTRTVETHIASVYGKIGVQNRVEATRWAIHAGLVPHLEDEPAVRDESPSLSFAEFDPRKLHLAE